jgi:homoprotocatechuate degradation regulator HpaR
MAAKRKRSGAEASVASPGKKTRAANDIVAQRELPMRAFTRSLPMELLRAREAVMRQFRPALREHGVTEQQWRILRALAHAGPLEVGALAEATCLLAPSLSRILPDMESRQLIVRRQAEEDLRRTVISLDRKGLRLISTHAPQSESLYAEITRRYGEARLNQLFTLLRELEEVLEAWEKEKSQAHERRRR